VSTHEQQGQGVVLIGALRRRRLENRRLELTARSRLLTANLIDQPPARRAEKPGAGVRWNALARPVVRGRNERLLDRVLGRVEVARTASERAEDLRRQGAEQVLDGGGDAQRPVPRAVSRKPSISVALEGDPSMIRRTMIGCSIERPPGPGAAEIFPAISTARASDSTSTIW
jgi:hypothetical protein